jgi:hypothetical protein
VVVGVPRWYTDGGDVVVISAVGTDRVYRDRVCQQSWQWYGVMVHWMHRGDDGDAVVVVSDVPVCGRRPKRLLGWGVHVEMWGLVRVWVPILLLVLLCCNNRIGGDDDIVVVAIYGSCRFPVCARR